MSKRHHPRQSFRYALQGMKYAIVTERHMKFHVAVSLVVVIAAVLLRLDPARFLFILLAITLVIVTELINTAVEKTVDLAMPRKHPLAKIAKDVSAAAVLVASVYALITGIVVFFAPVAQWLYDLLQ